MVGASLLDSDGTLYFGSQNGTCNFDPSSLFAAQIIAPVTITRFFVYSKQTESKDVETPLPLASGKITLPYNENTFKVSFNVLDYTQNSQVEFAYMMEGLEDVWYNTQGEKQVMGRKDCHTSHNHPSSLLVGMVCQITLFLYSSYSCIYSYQFL